MKHLAIVLLALLPISAQAVETDKVAHFAVSALLAQNIAKRSDVLTALALTLAIGVAKELHDPVFDKEDLAADAAGAVVGITLEW